MATPWNNAGAVPSTGGSLSAMINPTGKYTPKEESALRDRAFQVVNYGTMNPTTGQVSPGMMRTGKGWAAPTADDRAAVQKLVEQGVLKNNKTDFLGKVVETAVPLIVGAGIGYGGLSAAGLASGATGGGANAAGGLTAPAGFETGSQVGLTSATTGTGGAGLSITPGATAAFDSGLGSAAGYGTGVYTTGGAGNAGSGLSAPQGFNTGSQVGLKPVASDGTSLLSGGEAAGSGGGSGAFESFGGGANAGSGLILNSATGNVGTFGSTAPSSISLSNSAGLPASSVGSGSQFPSVLGAPSDTGFYSPGLTSADTALYNAPAQGATLSGGGNAIVGKAPSLLSQAGSYAAKYGLPIAGLATQLLRKPGIPQEGQLGSRYDSMNAAGTADINSARAGNISPSQRAQIDKFKSDSMEQIKQFMANSGQTTNSSAFQAEKQKVDQAAIAMEQGFVDQLFSQGLSELGLADSAQSQLIQLRMQREQQTSAALNNFMMTLGMMGAFA